MAKETKNKQQKKSDSANISKYILIAVLILVAGYFIYTNFLKKDEPVNNASIDPRERIKNIKEPVFRKEGELEFLDKDGKTEIKKIDIEIAEDNSERAQGLMYRKSMDEEKGMLFLFNKEEEQGFWMKNTIIPLDIIYVNAAKEIVKIYKNTTPFSEKDLPSEKPTLYVVEVNGGFTDKFGIKDGDKISYTRQ
jgi:uncharacterized protein